MSERSDTPRTDAKERESTNCSPQLHAHYGWKFARQLERECEALRVDAERYRWLRDEYTSKPFDERTALRGDTLDEAIDKAIGETKG
jgi:hypothetical protein